MTSEGIHWIGLTTMRLDLQHINNIHGGYITISEKESEKLYLPVQSGPFAIGFHQRITITFHTWRVSKTKNIKNNNVRFELYHFLIFYL